MYAIGLTLISIIFWGVTGVFAKFATDEVHPLVASYLSLFAALPTILVVAYIEGYGPQALLTLPIGAILAFCMSGLLTSLTGRGFYFLSVARIGASVTTSIGSSRVLIAPVAAVFLFHEELSWNVVAGTILVFSGLFFLTRD